MPDFPNVPRPTPARMLPQCPQCGESAQIHKETTVTSDVVRETYTCARCHTSWPATDADRSA